MTEKTASAPLMTPTQWLLGRDTGTSSKTICAVMTGTPLDSGFGPDIPYDPSDFGRCYRLLQHFPDWRERLSEVASAHPAWGPLVEAWDELSALFEQESQQASGRAPKLHARLRELRPACFLASGWTPRGEGCWEKLAA